MSIKNQASIYLAGRRAVLEILKNRPQIIKSVFLAKGASFQGELLQLIKSSRKTRIEFVELEREKLNSLSEQEPRGIVCEIKINQAICLSELLNKCSARAPSLLLICDGINDPHNLGGNISPSRSCRSGWCFANGEKILSDK